MAVKGIARPVLNSDVDNFEPVGIVFTNWWVPIVKKALSKKLDIKFLPRLAFVEDNSFEYAEKIERLIKKNKENEAEKKRYN